MDCLIIKCKWNQLHRKKAEAFFIGYYYLIIFLMNFFRKVFNHKVSLLERAGLLYYEGGNTYAVDSEMLFAPPYDIVIWTDSVSYHKSDKPISDRVKLEIINKIKSELERRGMSVEVG